MQGPWSGTYSSTQPIVPSNTAFVNCRAILCTGAGNLITQQGPPGAPSAAETIAAVAGVIYPIELNQGLVLATSTGTYLALA